MRSEQQVEAALKSYEDVDSWKTIIFLYNAGTRRDFHATTATLPQDLLSPKV